MNNEKDFEKDEQTAQETTTQPEQASDDVIILGEHMDEQGEASSAKEEPHTSTPKKKKSGFVKKHRNALLISGCLLVAVGGGFGGSLLALHVSNAGNNTVMYQSVDNSKKTTNATTTSIKTVASETMESVVEIKTESVSTNNYFQQAVVSGAGSGVILSKDGYIVTNHHVISGANKITVTTKDGKSYEATIVGSDSATDLAVIKIEAENLSPAVMGDSSKLEVGDTAIAIGNPLGSLGGTVTSGIISALDREVTIDNQKMHLLQTSAAINPGNSGGGLFNDKGELIGIVNAKSSGESIEGLGFAIPIDLAKDVITNLIENGYVKGRAALGVTLSAGSTNSLSENTSVYIYEIQSGKAADKAGLKAGDQLLKIDDESIGEISDATSIISSHTAGDKVKITVLRNNDTKTFTVTLDESSQTASETQEESSSNSNSNRR